MEIPRRFAETFVHEVHACSPRGGKNHEGRQPRNLPARRQAGVYFVGHIHYRKSLLKAKSCYGRTAVCNIRMNNSAGDLHQFRHLLFGGRAAAYVCKKRVEVLELFA